MDPVRKEKVQATPTIPFLTGMTTSPLPKMLSECHHLLAPMGGTQQALTHRALVQLTVNQVVLNVALLAFQNRWTWKTLSRWATRSIIGIRKPDVPGGNTRDDSPGIGMGQPESHLLTVAHPEGPG